MENNIQEAVEAVDELIDLCTAELRSAIWRILDDVAVKDLPDFIDTISIDSPDGLIKVNLERFRSKRRERDAVVKNALLKNFRGVPRYGEKGGLTIDWSKVPQWEPSTKVNHPDPKHIWEKFGLSKEDYSKSTARCREFFDGGFWHGRPNIPKKTD